MKVVQWGLPTLAAGPAIVIVSLLFAWRLATFAPLS